MRYIILLIIPAFIISCGSKIENKQEEKTGKINNNLQPYTLKPYESVITAEPKMDWVFGKNYKSWTPSDNDIEAAEKLFAQGFEEQKRGTVNRVLNMSTDDYDRQFVGAIDENGDKIIWINCFCKTEEKSFKKWREEIVHVADGGKCFVNVTVNLTKNIYTAFRVNGDA